MTEYINCNIEQLSIHKVGNKTNDEDLKLSKSVLETSDDKLKELLFSYFLKPFAETEFYNFTFSNDEFELNPLFNYATSVFEDSSSFHEISIKIARHLFEVSLHPNIKSGDLFVAKFSDIHLRGESTEAIGIFKSENRQAFLKIDSKTDDFYLNHDSGINIDKLDKGCLIFNVGKSEGYQVCIVDKSNKSTEAQYWRDVFLNLRPCNDNYHSTKEFLNITKNFVTKQVSEEFDVGKTDKINMLNRSVEYFKTHDSFNKEEFETTVFNDSELISSFQSFDNAYRADNEISINENFEISSQAVKKQARFFKSVLKLDKNFHIYIHGDKNKIEQGREADGRKFYKIYYDKEQ
jgi:hypothetical protein